jgi:hypothetical protein
MLCFVVLPSSLDSDSRNFTLFLYLFKKFILLFLGETDLILPIDNEGWLVRFLRPCKFYPESAHELVSTKSNYMLKSHSGVSKSHSCL